MRAGVRSLKAAGLQPKVIDIYRHSKRSDGDFRSLVLPLEVPNIDRGGIRIFHVNGNEVVEVLTALRDMGSDFDAGYNIIVPAWELPNYPAEWAEQLTKFDECWAISNFVKQSLETASLTCYYIGQSVDADFQMLWPRRYFGIRESAFAVLTFFDTLSYMSRKNPQGAARLCKAIHKLRPFDDIQFVFKARTGDDHAIGVAAEVVSDLPRGTLWLDKNLSSREARSLVNSCDCLVSLHRSEGFGRGLAEAMDLGRLALGTAWSGNTDFMQPENSLMVDYHLRSVEDGEYPHWQGQVWAEPDIDHATAMLLDAIDNPSRCRSIIARARRDVSLIASNRAVGVRALERLLVVSESYGITLE